MNISATGWRTGSFVLGAVLTITASVLARLERVRLASMPRMADFARVLAALDQTTRGQAGALTRYLGQADSLAATVADADPFVTALRAHIDAHGAWTGAPRTLLDTVRVPEPRSRSWPTTAQGVSAALTRAAPTVRQLGYRVDAIGRQAKTGRSLWAITPPTDHEKGP